MAEERTQTFADVVRELVETHGGGVQRALAQRGGLSHTYINEWLQGVRPTLRALTRFADELGLEGAPRARLFKAAGYIEDAWPSSARRDRRSKRSRLAAWVLDMAEKYPQQAGSLQEALQRGLARIHEVSDEEFDRNLRDDEEIIRLEAARNERNASESSG